MRPKMVAKGSLSKAANQARQAIQKEADRQRERSRAKGEHERKCRVCHHPMSEHGLNMYGHVYCQRDNCTMWLYCSRKETTL